MAAGYLDAQEITIAKVFDPGVVEASHWRRPVAVLFSDSARRPRSSIRIGVAGKIRLLPNGHDTSELLVNHVVRAQLGECWLGAPMPGGFGGLQASQSMPGRGDSEEDRAALYRRSAENLRHLAAQIRFNFGRQQQLLALAEAFDRLSERVEEPS